MQIPRQAQACQILGRGLLRMSTILTGTKIIPVLVHLYIQWPRSCQWPWSCQWPGSGCQGQQQYYDIKTLWVLCFDMVFYAFNNHRTATCSPLQDNHTHASARPLSLPPGREAVSPVVMSLNPKP